jgi:hypothetical protein
MYRPAKYNLVAFSISLTFTDCVLASTIKQKTICRIFKNKKRVVRNQNLLYLKKKSLTLIKLITE